MTERLRGPGYTHDEAVEPVAPKPEPQRPVGRRTLTSRLLGPDELQADPGRAELVATEDDAAVAGAATEPAIADDARAPEAAPTTGEPRATSAKSAEPEVAPTKAAPVADPVAQRAGEAWLGQVRSVLATTRVADVHACGSGCVHAQFRRMMASAGHNAPGLDVGSLAQKYKAWQKKQQSADKKPDAAAGDVKDAKDAKPAPAELASPAPAHADARTAWVGSVTAGKPKEFPDKMGKATWNYANFKYPNLNFKTEQKQAEGRFVTTIEKTTSADGDQSAIATPAGTYAFGTGITFKDDNDKDVVFTQQAEVDAAAAAQIIVAEQEHISDVTYAYTITLKAAETAVNNAAATPYECVTKEQSIAKAKLAVKNALDPKLTEDPANWIKMMQTCGDLSKTGRDDSGWHTFDIHFDDNDQDVDFKKKVVTYHTKPNPHVGTTPSSTLIKL